MSVTWRAFFHKIFVVGLVLVPLMLCGQEPAPPVPSSPAQPRDPLPMRKPNAPRPPLTVPPMVNCHSEKTHVLPGEIVRLVAESKGFDVESVRYVWHAQEGVLNGFGEVVVYDTAGLKPGVYEIFVDVTDCYDEKSHCSASVTVDSECPPDAVPSVRLQPDRASIIEGAGVDFNCEGVSPIKGTIQYRWTTSAGSLLGSGGHVRLDTSALKAPATVQVSCIVMDKCGSANLMAPVFITAVPRPTPQPINCVSGQFPYNSSRTNNVDKACLDDLALKMENDQAATLLITGYAGPNEHDRQTLALARAESAKAFLLKTHKIDARRIETRAAPEGSMLVPAEGPEGRRKNRGLQITFFPAGSAPK
jgi:hypothetical protein